MMSDCCKWKTIKSLILSFRRRVGNCSRGTSDNDKYEVLILIGSFGYGMICFKMLRDENSFHDSINMGFRIIQRI